MSRFFFLTRWINPWFWFCWIAHEFCVYKAGKWYTSSHPHWDYKEAKPFEWSFNKYGERPQDVFYKTWENRRLFWAVRLQARHKTYQQSTIEKFRRECGIADLATECEGLDPNVRSDAANVRSDAANMRRAK